MKMKPDEKVSLARQLEVMFRSFPASTIDPDVAEFFVDDVDRFALASAEAAIARFRRGELDRNHTFAPSVAEWVAEVRVQDSAVAPLHSMRESVFIEEGSPEWAAIKKARKASSLPVTEHDGRRGWYVKGKEMVMVQAMREAQKK